MNGNRLKTRHSHRLIVNDKIKEKNLEGDIVGHYLIFMGNNPSTKSKIIPVSAEVFDDNEIGREYRRQKRRDFRYDVKQGLSPEEVASLLFHYRHTNRYRSRTYNAL